MPDFADGFSARRDRKKDVDMMSNCQPCLRAIASAFGTFGCSMYPNFRDTLEKCFVMRRDPHPILFGHARRVGGNDRKDHIIFMQHFVVLEIVQ